MVTAAAIIDDTVFTSPQPAITKSLARVVSLLADAIGYQAVHDHHPSEEFWEAHVKQPVL